MPRSLIKTAKETRDHVDADSTVKRSEDIQQGTKHQAQVNYTGCLSSWISVGPYTLPCTDAHDVGNFQRQNAWMKIHSPRCYLYNLINAHLVIDNHCFIPTLGIWDQRYLGPLNQSIQFIFAPSHEGILKHTSKMWDLFTGTTHFAHTRLIEYRKPRK